MYLSCGRFFVPTSLFLAMVLGACGSSSHGAPEADAGGSDSSIAGDGGGSGSDGGGTITDGGGTTLDAGATDAGPPPPADSGVTPPMDSGAVTPPTDGGPGPTVPGSVGAACAADTDCDMLTAPMCMTTLGSGSFSAEFPGGYCTQTCTPTFGGGADDCPAGSACFGGGFGGFGAAFCGKTCSSDADCRTAETYTCQSAPFGGGPSVCAPPLGSGGGGGGMGGDSGLPFP